MPRPPRPILSGLAWAALAVLVWSGSLLLLRTGVTSGLTAHDLAALRFGTAGLLLAPVLLRGGTRLRLAVTLAMAASFGAPYVLLLSLAMKTAPAAAAGAVNPGAMAIASVLLARAARWLRRRGWASWRPRRASPCSSWPEADPRRGMCCCWPPG
ncbi:hypothetical protein [Mangrovicoccus sp. HB161399]|uniref:hypothetical protein n=1 Tax=Mangrovicoccus sp. HB161399 TaxID=2720392 RepID=UPI001C12EC7E|nr:hypothetical protein [Mangrovicoccus sp. HB161399]